MTDDVVFMIIIFAGPILFGAGALCYDLLAKRQHRRQRERQQRGAA